MVIKHHHQTNPYDKNKYIDHLTKVLSIYLSIHLLQKSYPSKLNCQEYSGNLAWQKFNQAIEYINDHLQDNLQTSNIANNLNISQYYLSRLFHQFIGISPNQYIIQQQVTKIKRLLKQTEMPITEIVRKCGFSSPNQMNMEFRKSTGISPEKYRSLKID